MFDPRGTLSTTEVDPMNIISNPRGTRSSEMIDFTTEVEPMNIVFNLRHYLTIFFEDLQENIYTEVENIDDPSADGF